MKQELEWVRQNPKGAPGQEQGAPGALRGAELGRIPEAQRDQEIFIPPGERLGDKVIEFKGRQQGLRRPPADRQPVVHRAARRDRRHHRPQRRRQVDLFKMITGRSSRTPAKIEIGQTVKLAYVDQSRDALEGRQDRLGGSLRRPGHPHRRPLRDAVARLHRPLQLQGRRPAEARRQPVRRRARAPAPGEDAAAGGNVLLLDEPSNDLDVETCARSRTRCSSSPAACVVISHDRWFLDRIATHILAFEGDSQVVFFPGNYQEYEADKKKRLPRRGGRPAASASATARDIRFFNDAPSSWIATPPGSFCLFFPEDAHAPLVSAGRIRKVVVKIAVLSD
jgi:energy-dependent translational throttle protein EttA